MYDVGIASGVSFSSDIKHQPLHIKHLLNQLADGKPLSREQAHEAFDTIMSGQAEPAQTAALLTFIRVRGATVDEIVGAATVMREKVTPVEVPAGLTAIDTCGMGGTGSTLFNISTTAAIVAAAAGRPHGVCVAKHGNRAVTSKSGSSQVLEALGVKIDVTPDTITRCMDEAGIGFCFAPAHHGAMKHAMPIRQALGFRTVFNLLGPLTNPAGATRQVIGVPTLELVQTIASVMVELEADHAMIVHSQLPDGRGLGELTTFGPNQIAEVRHGMIQSSQVDPETLGLSFGLESSVTVESPAQSAAMVERVLSGASGPARDIVRLNTAAALVVADLVEDLIEGLDRATEAIDSGAARAALDKLVAVTNE